GAAYVPLDPTYPESRNYAIAADAEARAIVLGTETRWRGPSLLEVRASEDDTANERMAQTLIAPDSSSYLLYTSGSTGRPKGVVVSHQNLAFSNAARDQVYGTEPQRFLLLSSVAFDSSVAGLFSTLANGGTLVLPQDEEATDSQALASLIERHRVTMLLCVPSLYAALLSESPAALRTLRIVIVAGESCPSALVRDHFERLPSTRLFNEYGPTEATVWASVHEFEAKSAGRPTSIGRPIPGVTVEVREDHVSPAPLGVLGQAWVVGPTVTSGYWNRGELTEERFRQEGAGNAYATGDLVSWTEEGTLLFHGRGDEQIKVRGVRIEPGEIESALLELSGVEQAVVVARGSAAGSTQLIAYLTGESLSEDSLTQAWSTLDQRLPPAMIPARSVVLAELPHLPNGKVDRAQLRALNLPERQVREAAGHVATALEESLRLLWQSLLGVEPVGLDDNLFELGGHSLLVVEMARVLKRDLGAEITPADVFQNPTIRALAR
ncbi:MAG: non-ribosomal peptide synthetase, partial [Planctomycetota bacterium]